MPERRRRMVVNKFQRKLIVRMAYYAIIYHFTLWNFLVFWKLLVAGGGGFSQQIGLPSQEFAPLLLSMLALVPIFIWDALKFSHRVAGPLVQFNRVIRDVADGRPVRHVQVREKDELKDLQDDFNDMLDYLSASGAVTLVSDEQASETGTLDAHRGDPAGAIEEQVSDVSSGERVLTTTR